MTRMFVRHKVEDFATWKAAYDAFDQERSGMGVTGHAAYKVEGNPNEVTVTHDFDDLAAAKGFADSVRLKEVMKEAGVVGAPEIWFAERA